MFRILFLSILISIFANCQSDDLDTSSSATKSIKIVNITPLDKAVGETFRNNKL